MCVYVLMLVAGLNSPDASGGASIEIICESLARYYESFSSYRMTYEEKSSPLPGARARMRAEAEEAAQRAMRSTDNPAFRAAIAELQKRRAARGDPEITKTYDLSEAYPALRLRIRTVARFPTGDVDEQNDEWALFGGKRYSLNHSAQRASIETTENRQFLPPLPIHAVGVRMPQSLNFPLSELLAKASDVVTIEGRREVHGLSVLSLKVGPKIPETLHDALGPLWNREGFLELMLIPQYGYVPKQITRLVCVDGLVKPDQGYETVSLKRTDGRTGTFFRYSIIGSDYRAVQDRKLRRKVYFPHQIVYEDPRGSTTRTIVTMDLNPSLSRSDFVPVIPDGYALVKEGRIRELALKGGKQAYREKMHDSAAKARELLAKEVPSGEDAAVARSLPYLPLTIGSCALALALAAGILFVRSRR